jgi:putative ABC transport system permease protein
MFANYALALYRTLTRHRLYAALNTLGLALGVAVCATLFLVWRFETSFDRWVPHHERVVRFNLLDTFPGRPPGEGSSTQAVLLPALRQDFPQIEAGARVWAQEVVVRAGGRQAFEEVALADPEVFDLFGLTFVRGDARSALPDTNSLVVSRTMARKYFGTENAVGRTLTVVFSGQPRTYRVTGVLKDLPANTHLALGMVARYDLSVSPSQQELLTRWGSSMLYTYVRLRDRADIATLQSQMPAFVDRRAHDGDEAYSRDVLGYRLVPLADIHFRDSKTGAAFKPGADPLFVNALGIMGAVTLLVAIVNYVSLATARAGLRAREVAVRKVMGATRRALVVQFVAESVAMAVVSGLIAAALMELVLPGVSAMLGQSIRLTYLGPDGLLAPLVGLCLVVGLMAGVYPALVLSGFRPASVLASARTPGGGRAGARVREALAIGQFAIAIALMVCTAVVFAQIQFVRNADLGFRRDGLILVEGVGEPAVAPQMHAIMDAFKVVPGVISATASERRPGTDNENNGNMTLADNPKAEVVVTRERMGPDYARTYGLTLVAGRHLGLEQRLDDRMGMRGEEMADRGLNVLVNETAARAFGFRDPAGMVGKRIKMGVAGADNRAVLVTVVGVTRDVRFLSPRTPTPPQIYMQDSTFAPPDRTGAWTAAIRVRADDVPVMTRRLEAVWRTMAPGVPFRSETVASALKPYYDPDARRGQLFAAGSALSGVIACLGLYGLASFNTTRRTKEIGIRKTLGASTADVLRLLIGEFLRPVLWANLIAWPVAWFAMRSWLAGFDQRIDLNPAYFLAPTIAALIVAVATVAGQTLRVARSEPARALRYE